MRVAHGNENENCLFWVVMGWLQNSNAGCAYTVILLLVDFRFIANHSPCFLLIPIRPSNFSETRSFHLIYPYSVHKSVIVWLSPDYIDIIDLLIFT